MPRLLVSLLVSLLLPALAVTASAGESAWPSFRGPDSNPVGESPRLPERWSTTENVEWNVEIPGRGWSSPIVAGEQVFVTAAVTEGESKKPQIGTDFSNEYVAELSKQGLSQDEILARVTERDIELPSEVELHYYLYCLDLSSGELLWRREVASGRPPGGRHRKNSFMSETPVTDGEAVYVYVANLGLYAYDLAGERLWTRELKSYPIYLDFGPGASAALHGERLIVLNDNEERQFLAAFDKRSGKEIWRTERDIQGDQPRRSGWSTPYVWEHEKGAEIVTVGPGRAIAYDLDGRELWSLEGMTGTPAPTPFAYGGLLILDAGQGRSIYAIRPGARGDVTPEKASAPGEAFAWVAERAGTYIPTPVAYDGYLYVVNDKGILTRLDAATGEVSYKGRLDRDGAAFTASPWAYDGKVFAVSETGVTYVFGAGDELEVLGKNPLGEMALATPAIVGDRLLVRTETQLYSIREGGD